MKKPQKKSVSKIISTLSVAVSIVLISQSGFAEQNDKIHAFYADEHNVPNGSSTGNRVIEIDIENMSLVDTLGVPGVTNHHADRSFNSKLYAVPKGSGYVNVVRLRKDQNGSTSMKLMKQIPLIHQPRSGDAYNKKFNVILMAARNRPMGSFIDVDTDEVVGTIGENVDCKLKDGSFLLSHSDANLPSGANKYQCTHKDNGGDQISGHPYWLTPDYAAIVDRTNRQISVYYVWKEGNRLKSRLVNHLKTRTSVHQIVPRDRTTLPLSQQADFYAVEEGNLGSRTSYGKAHALLKMKLTNNGLILIKRMELARNVGRSTAIANKIARTCIDINRKYGRGSGYTDTYRYNKFKTLFNWARLSSYSNQDRSVDFPVECLNAKDNGGHNGDFAPDNKHLYVGSKGGFMHIINVDTWKVENTVDTGGMSFGRANVKSGSGHTCFAGSKDLAIVTNHKAKYNTIIQLSTQRKVKNIALPFTNEGIFTSNQSHTCYVDDAQNYYYNFWTDGGVFYKINLNYLALTDSLYTGGIPIQGNYLSLSSIQSNVPNIPFVANNDTATSTGNQISINVLSNDTGNNLVLAGVDSAQHGQVSISNGQLLYTPNTGFSGTDTFWYAITSSSSTDWKWAAVTVTVTSTVQPSAFQVNNDTATTTAGNAVTIDILANDTGTGLSIGWFDNPANGTLTISNNKLAYTPNNGFIGTDDFWCQVIDSSGNSGWGLVQVTVGNGNGGGTSGGSTTLQANNDTATVSRNGTVTIDVVANDTGVDVILANVDTTWTGSATIVNNKLVFTAGNEVANLELWYSITDASGNEEWAKVTITIN